jgi:hypothetical protein
LTADVIPLATAAARLDVARSRHPAGRFVADGLPTIEDPAAALVAVAREWDRLHRDLTHGPGALSDDTGYEVLQVMVAGLVHRAARPGLVLTWTQVLAAVRRYEQVRDSDLEPLDVGCSTYAEAVAKADAELDWQLFPLVHGLPSRDACTDCVRTCASVNAWQTRLGCTEHQNGRVI